LWKMRMLLGWCGFGIFGIFISFSNAKIECDYCLPCLFQYPLSVVIGTN
jgi:hypothetical protein